MPHYKLWRKRFLPHVACPLRGRHILWRTCRKCEDYAGIEDEWNGIKDNQEYVMCRYTGCQP